MLSYLTYKLRAQKLNEDQSFHFKAADDDHDSGTESDDEQADADDMETAGMDNEQECFGFGKLNCPKDGMSDGRRGKNKENLRWDNIMSDQKHLLVNRDVINSDSPLDGMTDSALPSDSDHNFDHHSSEEELETINSSSKEYLSFRDSIPEKRKWSQINNRHSFGESSGSSDDELQGLTCSPPVEFRASPPADAHKPGTGGRRHSPPAKLLHYSSSADRDKGLTSSRPLDVCSISPRKRQRSRAHNIQRPCLDFEKMQQLKARPVTKWRQGGELSLFCG